MRHPGILLLCGLPLLALSLIGCGGYDYGPTGTIRGKLTMQGKPLSPGTAVSFMQMEKGFLAFGLTDAEGKFEVKSWNEGAMPIGVYKVMVAPPASAPPPPQNYTAEELFDKPELLDPVVKAEFPMKYRDTQTSGLEFEVKAGENSCEFDLQP